MKELAFVFICVAVILLIIIIAGAMDGMTKDDF